MVTRRDHVVVSEGTERTGCCHCKIPPSQLWKVMEIGRGHSNDWRQPNVTCVFKKGQKGNPGNCRLVSLTLNPGKILKKVLLEDISGHIRE